MNLHNSTYSFRLSSVIILLSFALLSTNCYSQFIENKKGEITNGDLIFNPSTIKNRKVKSIEVTFFEKKELKGIFPVNGKVNNYLFDEEGRLIRYYFTKNYYSSFIDTVVEWRYYKNNRLVTTKTATNKNIETKSIFYEDNKPSIHIYGISLNGSNDITKLKIKNYTEKSAEYINRKRLKNGDTLVEWSFTDKTIFKRKNISIQDSSIIKETVSFPLKKKSYKILEYTFRENLLSKLIETNSNSPDFYYYFIYDSSKNLVGYSKYDRKWQSEIETNEVLYEEETGNPQAILTKNKINNSIKIKKFNYTYF